MGLLNHEHLDMSKSMSESTDMGFIGLWHMDIGGDRVVVRISQRNLWCEIGVLQHDWNRIVEGKPISRICWDHEFMKNTNTLHHDWKPPIDLLCLFALMPSTPINKEDYKEEVEQLNTSVEPLDLNMWRRRSRIGVSPTTCMQLVLSTMEECDRGWRSKHDSTSTTQGIY